MTSTRTAIGSSALEGVRVVDLSRILGGPYCTQILGDHGADVIKVEPPSGDDTRRWGPPFEEGGTTAYFRGINRNKRGIVLDLSDAEQRARLLGLLADADVLVENFKPGTMERWGLGYEQYLRDRFPRLIHCRVSGYGANGPLGGQPGYDATMQAISGLMSVNGEPGGGPLRIGVPVVDMVTGLNAVIGILLALQERHSSGLGQLVEAALFDSAVSLLHPHMANFLASGKAPVRTGNAHPNIAPYEIFATATTPIFLAVGNDGQFEKFCSFAGLDGLAAEPRFATNGGRLANRDALRERIQEALRSVDGKSFADELLRRGVPCSPVLGLPELVEHEQFRASGMLVEMNGYRGGGNPVRLSRTPPRYRLPPPRLGEHNDEIVGGS